MNTKEVVKDSRIQIRIEKNMIDEIKKEAEEEGMSMSEYVIRSVDFYRFCHGKFGATLSSDRPKEKATEID